MRNMRLYQSKKRIPRGEMWLGHGLFQELGWEDDLKAHVRLCRYLTMDIVFLPVTLSYPHNHLFDYRYFSLDDVSHLVTESHGLLVGAIVDGPFQQLSQKIGLQQMLQRWLKRGTIETLQEEANQVGQLVLACLECKPDALVIADDIAYHHSTFVSPKDLEQFLFIFYRDWVQQAHNLGIPIFFHSDGRLTDVFSTLLACDFDGLAGCQLEYLDLRALPQQYKSQLVLLDGIPNDLLEKEELDFSHQKQFAELLTDLTSVGHLVLCSSSGLSSARHLSRLRTLYQWADEALGSKVKRKYHALSN